MLVLAFATQIRFVASFGPGKHLMTITFLFNMVGKNMIRGSALVNLDGLADWTVRLCDAEQGGIVTKTIYRLMVIETGSWRNSTSLAKQKRCNLLLRQLPVPTLTYIYSIKS
jgi:hypothetical protein